MRKLTVDDITDLRAYERERDVFRTRIMELKRRRRIPLGDLMTIVFENTDTMRFQVQEMARAERMLSDEQIADEVATYNELIPDEGELSGTLFIEIADKAELVEWLPKLTGIQRAVRIMVGDASIEGFEDEDRLTREEEVTTTVHYLKFAVSAELRPAFARGPVRIVVDHAAYRSETELDDEQREDLARDLGA